MGPWSKATDREVELLMQFLEVPTHQVAHLHVLEVMPAPLVPRVQVGGVTRQGLQPDLAARLGHELADLRPSVDRRAVPDHQQPLASHAPQVQEELDDVQSVERPLPRQDVELSCGRHPTHDRQVVARLGLVEDRRPCLGGVRLDHTRQQVESRFILEDQHPALAPRSLSQFGPDRDAPALDSRLIALDGPPDRHLGRPAESPEQPADVVLVVANAELLLDDESDAGAGPDLAPKAIGLRAMPEELRDEALLLGSQPGTRPGAGWERRASAPSRSAMASQWLTAGS